MARSGARRISNSVSGRSSVADMTECYASISSRAFAMEER
jgi:hypothetical protein